MFGFERLAPEPFFLYLILFTGFCFFAFVGIGQIVIWVLDHVRRVFPRQRHHTR